jgi:hypothetical protein
MGWFSIASGVLVILLVNVQGVYHKDRMPKWYLRVSMTLMGLVFLIKGIYRLRG